MTAYAAHSQDPGGFHVVRAHDDGQIVLRLTGELDCDTAPVLRQALDELGGRTAATLVLDVAELQFIDSSGLHELVQALHRQRAAGGEVVLKQPTPQTMRVLEIVGLSPLFRITDPPPREAWEAWGA
jgi:anti-anti-sigma factor